MSLMRANKKLDDSERVRGESVSTSTSLITAWWRSSAVGWHLPAFCFCAAVHNSFFLTTLLDWSPGRLCRRRHCSFSPALAALRNSRHLLVNVDPSCCKGCVQRPGMGVYLWPFCCSVSYTQGCCDTGACKIRAKRFCSFINSFNHSFLWIYKNSINNIYIW